jgi:hypothetical protein
MKLHSCPLSLALLATACAGASSGGPLGSTSSALTGPVELRVAADDQAGSTTPPVDADRPTHIVVTIERVDARIDDASGADVWWTLSVGPHTVDLLALPATGFASLGVTELPAGGMERLRLLVSPLGPNDVVTADGATHLLAVPSGEVQIAGDFDAGDCAAGEVTLAFAGRESIEVSPTVNVAGATGIALPWVLRPVIRVKEATLQGSACTTDGEHGDGDGHGDRH